MSQPILKVFLVVGENCETEAYALRAILEYFQIQVTTRWIGRPNDFIDIISAKECLKDIDYLLLSFHGDEQRFCMPKLGSEIYTQNEPRSKFFTAKDLEKFATFDQLKVIATGCTLGAEQLAKVMLKAGAKKYLAPIDYVDGNASLMFLTQFFYHLTLGDSTRKAWRKAAKLNKETQLYHLYETQGK